MSKVFSAVKSVAKVALPAAVSYFAGPVVSGALGLASGGIASTLVGSALGGVTSAVLGGNVAAGALAGGAAGYLAPPTPTQQLQGLGLSPTAASQFAGAGYGPAEIQAMIGAGTTPAQFEQIASGFQPSTLSSLLGSAKTAFGSASTPGFGSALSSLVQGGAALYGGSQASQSAAAAALIQKQASDAALAEQKRQYDLSMAETTRQYTQGRELLQPWVTQGGQAREKESALMGLGGQSAEAQLEELMQSPGYQFRLGEGQKTLERGAAARGGLFSGAAGKGLARYGQDYASSEYGNRLSQLSGVSTRGQSAAAGQAGYGTQYAGTLADIGKGYANTYGVLTTDQANAAAASKIAQANAKQSGILGVGNALSNLFNPPPTNQFSLANLLRGY